jgi:glutamate racemase
MLEKAHNPIGIFDSGMGGLTVAKTITEQMPNENIVYFGDTAHTPWGDKSVSAIQAYSIKICDVLLQHDCKFIVIACHTASTAAYELVREYVGNKAYVINVIDPMIHHIRKHHANKKVGLIGTKQTVRSNTYQKRLESLDQNIQFASLATPLLVPLIEEGFAHNEISERMIGEYLTHPALLNIKALILGCTHYPLLKQYIQNFYEKNTDDNSATDDPVDIIDASDLTAKALKKQLALYKLENKKNANLGTRLFYVSDHTEFFENTAKIFFPGEIELKPYSLWE